MTALQHGHQLSFSGVGLHSSRLDFTPDRNERPKALCLFSSAGIGELGIQASGLEVVVANELLPSRVDLYRSNFPEVLMIEGDIWEQKERIVDATRAKLGNEELFLLYATPPCQGMSSNGAGKLSSEIAAGRRVSEDPRNRLIVPTMEIAAQMQPRFVLLENVPQMVNTVIRNENDQPELILDFVKRRLGPAYDGRAEVMACQDFGIAQRRKRLITVFTRDKDALEFMVSNGGSFVDDSMRSPLVTLRQAIGHLPPLDAVEGLNANVEFHPQHRVPIMNPRKHWWVRHTPEGATAFNNSCINPDCGSSATRGHREEKRDGRWIAPGDTPLHCVDCGDLLPRPSVVERDGSLRPLKGFHSAYRRMKWDEPARTLTQNFIYEASDNKIHPDQNRVLSVYEAMVLQTIAEYEFDFEVAGRDIGIPRIAEVIGESVAPRLIEILCSQMLRLTRSSEPVR